MCLTAHHLFFQCISFITKPSSSAHCTCDLQPSIRECVRIIVRMCSLTPFTSLICSLTSEPILGEQRFFFYKPIILLDPFSGCHFICLFDTLWEDKSKRGPSYITTRDIMGMFTVSFGWVLFSLALSNWSKCSWQEYKTISL